MLNYKILMLDLDGTLVHKHNHIDKKTGFILKKFVANGGMVMFNTGRSLLSSLKIKKILEKKYQISPTIISCFNGSIIYDCIENKIVKQYTIDDKIVKTLTNACQSINVKIGIYDGDNSSKNSLILANTKPKTIKFLNSLNKKFDFVEYDQTKEYQNVYKMLCFLSLSKKKSNKLNSKLENELIEINRLNHVINYAKPTNFLCEITSNLANKGLAIPVMIETINKHGYDYSFRDICAIGDSENDLPMFGKDAINQPTVGLALALGLKLNETHKISNEANKTLKKPYLLAKFIKKFVFKCN